VPRVTLCLLLSTLAVGAPSCDGDDGDTEPPRISPHPGETFQLTVENRAGTRLEYGLAYRLERRVGSRWRWINRDAAFALILKIVEPGKREREEIRLPRNLRPGLHRIVKSFTAPATGLELDAAVQFTVAGL
jgi:hypothetical protein